MDRPLYRRIVYILLFAILCIQCGKKTPGPSSNKNDIYFAGYLGGESIKRGVLWKNGKIEFEAVASNHSIFNDVTVLNGDQYVVGYIQDANYVLKANLWKNGEVINLLNSNRAHNALRIEIVNNRPVILLFEENGMKYGYGSIKLWDNGTITEITNIDQAFTPMDFTFHNGTYYMAGYHVGQQQQMTPVLISGSKIDYLPILENHTALATSLAVVNNKTYVLGIETDIYGNNHIVYWINGERQRLTHQGETGWALRINVKDQDVYVGGDLKLAGTSFEFPTIWKNGITKHFSEEAESGRIVDFEFNGEDEHVVGQSTQHSLNKIKYWKNGISQPLEKNDINGLILRIHIDTTKR